MPNSLQKSLCDVANHDGVSINQFIPTEIAETFSALMTENYLKARTKRSNQLKYEAILAKVPDVEAEYYDKLPNNQD